MAKIEITKTELVWPGKYNDDGTSERSTPCQPPFSGHRDCKRERLGQREKQGRGRLRKELCLMSTRVRRATRSRRGWQK